MDTKPLTIVPIFKTAIPAPALDFTPDPAVPQTPKTPADEGLEFFESPLPHGAPIQVYELTLEEDGGPNKSRAYTRLPPPYTPYILRVTLEPGTFASKNGVFKTNFPLEGGKFDRDTFIERKLPTDFSKPIKIDLPISQAGAYVYWLEYDNPNRATPERVKGREGYFNIDPILRVPKRGPILSSSLQPLSYPDGGAINPEKVNVPLDGISMLTVVSKWMGPLAEWGPFLAECQARGYNMLHFTPLQQSGESQSPYSLADQLVYDKKLFGDEKVSPEDGLFRVHEMLKTCKEKYGLMSLTDVVLNHTANNSPWLLDHPEAGFSPLNSPHLNPAVELDDAMIAFSDQLTALGLPTRVESEADIEVLIKGFTDFLKPLNLWEYYVFDVPAQKARVKAAFQSSSEAGAWDGPAVAGKTPAELADILRAAGKVLHESAFLSRLCVDVDIADATALVKAAFPDLTEPEARGEAWGNIVNVLNVQLYREWEEDTKIALDGIKNRLKYIRLDANGPRMGEINATYPLVETYFTRLPRDERTAKHDPRALSLANNGWIWNADPLQNFAQPPSKAYLRREVIVWSDCVKLRYGKGREDSPWLWDHMTHYVEYLAEAFDGFRLDNCHSTPLHVGVALLDAARVVNPDLYVCAELFTGNEETDIKFVSRLGINSLIREAMNGWDTKETSRLLYSYGLGKPIGSMDGACLTSPEELAPPTGKGPTRPSLVTPLQGSAPHALLYDLTHDNESPLHKRTAEDALSTGALTTFAWAGTGSVKGFDDLHPKLLNLVAEGRRYEVFPPGSGAEKESGIAGIKRVLNHLHVEMVLEGYSEGHVHQENEYIVIHRVQPTTQRGYILVAHTGFSKGKERGFIAPIKLRRTKTKFILGAILDIPSYEIDQDPNIIKGLPSTIINIAPFAAVEGSDGEGPYSEIHVPEVFPPGSILLFESHIDGIEPKLDEFCKSGADEAFQDLDLVDLNVVLHRASGEERDATNGEIGAYNVPGHGDLVYCGLEGWMGPLRKIIQRNDLGHALCGHLREGTWAFDYIHSRLTKQVDTFPHLAKVATWFKERFDRVKDTVPSFLRPKFFAIIISEAYKAARRAVIEQCSAFVATGHSFTQNLALCSVQMHGLVKSASLSPGEPTPSLAAGLPHFAAGWARCWGRDVFISLRGLFLTTGHYDAARKHILAFCSTLKHGLIPNLLDSIRNPRYNSRDSPWWMVQNIQDYANSAPDGLSILSESVKRRFPADDTYVAWDDPRAYAYSSTVAEVIQEILQRHARGISFREHNAGPNLDMQMSDGGFNIDVRVDWNTGLILGGNEHNCGTWMDKMGESVKAGTKGTPGTPRDGAPVEIIGLLKSTLRWLDELSSAGKFPFKGVDAEIDGVERLVTYKEWSDLIQNSFEKYFYVPLDSADDSSYQVNTNLVNRRGIYKDVYGSGAGREWSDYQFRCNFPIAMTVAPELFDPVHALGALRLADAVLRSPLGMKTLDPNDAQYRGDYDNSNDSTDASIAKGLNYHQGPEWGWPLGYFLRAYLHFDRIAGRGKEDINETLHHIHTILLPSRRHIIDDPWAGIPELTNHDGGYCHDSCRTQAWSASTLLDILEEVHKLSAQ